MPFRRDVEQAHMELMGILSVRNGERAAWLVGMGRLADRIQKLSHKLPELTALCGFEWPQRLRRLVNVPAKAWGPMEMSWALQAVKRIGELRAMKDDLKASLALACLGVWGVGVEGLVEQLEHEALFTPDPSLAAVETAPADGETPGPEKQEAESDMKSRPAEKPRGNKSPAKDKQVSGQAAGKPAVLASLGDVDEAELDPQTLADLKALEAEVKALQGAN